MVTQVRERVTRDLLGRRGTVADPVWVNRWLLLTAAEHLSPTQWKWLGAVLDNCENDRLIWPHCAGLIWPHPPGR
jgi:hypothetical protein